METKKNKIETRAYLCDVTTREDEHHGTVIEGMPIVFGKRTDMGPWDEVIDQGALDGADLRDVRLLVNHDTTQLPLARSRNNNENSTMQLRVTEEGMSIRADLDTENNVHARELRSAVERGDVSGMSFMFTIDEDRWEDPESDHPTRHLVKIGHVFEVSAVTFPAYEQTTINARSLDSGQASLDSAKEALESARKMEELRKSVKERAERLADGGNEKNDERA